MKKQTKQFENNISRLLKTGRQSNTPPQEFTNTLIDEALNELESDQHRRQKRSKPTRSHFPKWLKVAAVFLICGGLLGSVVITIRHRLENKLQSITTELDGGQDLPDPPDLPDLPDFQK